MKDARQDLPGLPYTFSRPELLVEALTHRSRGSLNYERLEFLGDAVLSFVVSSELYRQRPDDNEGNLSRLRSRVVRGVTLAKVSRQLNLGDHLIMGGGELSSGGYLRDSILADVLESLIGAIYLDGGLTAAQDVILQIFGPVIEALPDAELLKDPKTRLQELLQAQSRPLPEYYLERETGADHAKQFTICCRLNDSDDQQCATAASRRKAEQAAAALMLESLSGKTK